MTHVRGVRDNTSAPSIVFHPIACAHTPRDRSVHAPSADVALVTHGVISNRGGKKESRQTLRLCVSFSSSAPPSLLLVLLRPRATVLVQFEAHVSWREPSPHSHSTSGSSHSGPLSCLRAFSENLSSLVPISSLFPREKKVSRRQENDLWRQLFALKARKV